MTQFVFANFAESTLDQPLGVDSATLLVADAGVWPVIPDGFRLGLVLYDGRQRPEIVWATARNAYTFTVERAREGTTANAWGRGTAVIHTITASSILAFTSGGAMDYIDDLAERLDVLEAWRALVQIDIDALGAAMDDVNNIILETIGPYTLTVQQIQQAFADIDSAWALFQVNLLARVDDVEASLTTTNQALVTLTDSIVTQFTELNSRVGDAESALEIEAQTRADADTAAATYSLQLRADLDDNIATYTGLVTTVTDNYTALTSVTDTLTAAVAANSGAITNESLVRITEDAALASAISSLAVSVGEDITAAVTAEAEARADADDALASTITTLSATVDDVSSDLTIVAAVVADIEGNAEGKYVVSLNADGVMGGFEILVGSGPAGPSYSSFKITAADFIIYDPSGDTVPFQVTGGVTYMQNVVVDFAYIENVVIETGMIEDLAVTSAKIDDLAVTSAKIDNLAVVSAKIGDLEVETIKIKNAAVSDYAVAYSTGVFPVSSGTEITAQSLTYESEGGRIHVRFGLRIFDNTAGPSAKCTIRVYRKNTTTLTDVLLYENDALVLLLGGTMFGNPYQELIDTPAADEYEWRMTIDMDDLGGETYDFTHRLLIVEEVKK